MLTSPVILDSLNRIITSDYRGSADKTDALKQIIAPLIETLRLSGTFCPKGTKANMDIEDTIKLLSHHGLV